MRKSGKFAHSLGVARFGSLRLALTTPFSKSKLSERVSLLEDEGLVGGTVSQSGVVQSPVRVRTRRR